MIQANELRIGNRFIRELPTTRGLEYDHDFILTAGFMVQLFHLTAEFSIEKLFPIPITEEILLKCGFKKFSHEPGYSIGSEELDVLCDEYTLGELTVMNWGKGFVLSNSFSFDLRVEIKSLHHLQNLYFALTRTELQINQNL